MVSAPVSNQREAAASADAACFHCGLPAPRSHDYHVEIDGEAQPMCCPGCQAVAQAIVDAGLTDFYRYRTDHAPTPEQLVPELLRELELYDRDDLQQGFVHREGEHVKEAALILEGITCAACMWLNERHVSRLPGVVELTANYASHRARVRWDEREIRLSDILKAITDIGYRAHPFDPGRQAEAQGRERAVQLKRLAAAGLGMLQVMMLAVALYAGEHYGMDPGIRDFLRWVSLIIAAPVVLYAAQPFFRNAWGDLRRRQLGMDVPVGLAIGSALGASAWATVAGAGEVYFDSAVMFTFFLLTGRFLEMRARHRAGEAAEALVRLLPASATRIGGDDDATVPVSDLRAGDRVRVRPGETVPADAEVVEGTSAIDESLLTGESLPKARGPGDAVVGGTVNRESPLVLRVTRVGADTVLSAIQRLLDRAQSQKPRVAQLADRVAAWFVGGLLILAAGVGAAWYVEAGAAQAFTIVLAVLVVTCPCALSLATPAALTAATGSLTRIGFLVTRGHTLETLARATRVVFDKTGTLTEGRVHLAETVPLGEISEERALAVAAALERASEHPLARAITDAAPRGPAASDVTSRPGYGVEGTIEGKRYRAGGPDFVAELSKKKVELPAADEAATWVVLGDETGPIARFRMEDRIRLEAARAVARLRDLGLEVELLSGDREGAARATASALGIETVRGGASPEGKLARLRELESQGEIVAMVGDGVNDAPVLAGAPVSIAMGEGTELAQASADVVLLSGRLTRLAEGIATARRARGVIAQNLTWAVLYNAVALPLAALGWVAPWMAAIGMSASSLAVVTNALRLTGARNEAG